MNFSYLEKRINWYNWRYKELIVKEDQEKIQNDKVNKFN
jgi:hypothetical protein